MERKLIVYISMTLDGYLATVDDDLSFLDRFAEDGEDYGYTSFCEQVDTYMVGRSTYDVVTKLTGGEFPQAETMKCYVITRQHIPDTDNIRFYNGDLATLVRSLKANEGKNIYCDGGGQLVRSLLAEHLIDEFIISVIPTILGDGKLLFPGGAPQQELELIGSTAYRSGLVQLHYLVKHQ